MKLFSHRKGLKKFRDTIQKNNIDAPLRNGLWNMYHLFIWDKYKDYASGMYADRLTISNSNLASLITPLWHFYFQDLLDTLPDNINKVHQKIREYFFSCDWNEVYDFIEATAIYIPNELKSDFVKGINKVLKSELSAYRLIRDNITEITSDEEIQSIEEALTNTEPLKNVHSHLQQALHLLSDKKNPDYRNSIKESISAVEALARKITNKEKATLGEAIGILKRNNDNLHPAFLDGLNKIYGYTSDGGIRHSIMDEDTLTFADAKFLYVSCTAFINYFIDKTSQA